MSDGNSPVWKSIAAASLTFIGGLALAWVASTSVLDAKFKVVEEELHTMQDTLDDQKKSTERQAESIHNLEMDVAVLSAESKLRGQNR